MRLLRVFVFILLIISNETFAKSTKKHRRSQRIVVKVNGAVVYALPSFDAKVLGYLKRGAVQRGSVKTFQGPGGLGAFYKIKWRTGAYGYVTDVDVQPEFKYQSSRQRLKENPKFNEVAEGEETEKPIEPLFFTRYFGVTLGSIDYHENLLGKTVNTDTTVFGIQMTGPETLGARVPLDFRFLFHEGVPDFYEKITKGPPSGFFILSDLMLILPFAQWEQALIQYGLGISLLYTNYDLTIGNTNFDSQELRGGLVGGISFAYRVSPQWVIRVGTRYHYEKHQYFGYSATVQMAY